MAIAKKLEECRQCLQSVNFSLRLFNSEDPLPHFEVQNLGIRAQTLLGKRKRRALGKQ